MHAMFTQCLSFRPFLPICISSMNNSSKRNFAKIFHANTCYNFKLPIMSLRNNFTNECFRFSSAQFQSSLLKDSSLSFNQSCGMKIYTKTGDKGTSGTLTGKRHSKDHELFVALGTLDELSAHIGLAKEFACERDHPYTDQLERVQCLLQDAASCVASAPPYPNPGSICSLTKQHVGELEGWIDEYSARLPPLNNFILPGGGRTSAGLQVARTICRRAERTLVALRPRYSVPQDILVYINRLSDFLFTIARYATVLDGSKEVIYINPNKPRVPVLQPDSPTLSEA